MTIPVQDLQMWAESTGREVYIVAFQKARQILEQGFDARIDQVDSNTINVVMGKYTGNKLILKKKRQYTPRKKKLKLK